MKYPKTCFIIMPYGKKSVGEETVNFDDLYQNFIKTTVEKLNIECVRCDEIDEAGMIHLDMFRRIYEDEIAIVDLTSLNANVFYELGLRHALRSRTTILIRRNGTRLPFNIKGLRVISYDDTDVSTLAEAQKDITKFIKNSFSSLEIDSPIYHAIEGLQVRRTQIVKKQETIDYGIGKQTIGIKTGDIVKIKDVDVWVNSENTNMLMARHFDQSISGIIRYMGAEKDIAGHVSNDIVADALKAKVGAHLAVMPGTIIPTTSGELLKSNKVKRIFHAAAVTGETGKGYAPIRNLDVCVRQALEHMEKDDKLNSIIFPLLATGDARGDAEEITGMLIETAFNYFEENPDSRAGKVYFLAYTKAELEICRYFMEKFSE